MAKSHQKQRESLTTQYPPCFYCRHLKVTGTLFLEHDIKNSLQGWSCRAFPEGIPYDILRRYSTHAEPAAGQKGTFVFTSKRIDTGGGETGFQFATFDGRWIEEPEERTE